MSLGPFVEGEQPADPLVLTVVDAAGDTVDFDDYDTVTLSGTLPAGTATPLAGGVLQYKATEPFTEVGTFEIRVVMSQDDGDVDYSQPFEYTVEPALVFTSNRVTPDVVFANTGSAVSPQDIARAQADVNLFVARNLGDDALWDDLLDTDVYWLGLAISHQAAFTAAGGFDLEVPIGANSVSAGGVAVSMSSGFSIEGVHLAPLAKMALKHVSWVSNRTMHATPFLGGVSTPERPMWETVKVLPL